MPHPQCNEDITFIPLDLEGIIAQRHIVAEIINHLKRSKYGSTTGDQPPATGTSVKADQQEGETVSEGTPLLSFQPTVGRV